MRHLDTRSHVLPLRRCSHFAPAMKACESTISHMSFPPRALALAEAVSVLVEDDVTTSHQEQTNFAGSACTRCKSGSPIPEPHNSTQAILPSISGDGAAVRRNWAASMPKCEDCGSFPAAEASNSRYRIAFKQEQSPYDVHGWAGKLPRLSLGLGASSAALQAGGDRRGLRELRAAAWCHLCFALPRRPVVADV